MIPLIKYARVVKFRDRVVVHRLGKEGERYSLMGTKFQFCKMERVLEMDEW